jgi:hypothetical protein
MQIHELNRPRRADEGLGDWAKVAGTALKQAATGPEQNTSAASAGILDPKQKLAAVMKEPAMVKLATQYADEWLKDPKSQGQVSAQAAPPNTAQSQQSSWVGQNTNVPAVQRKAQAQTTQPVQRTAPQAPSQQPVPPGETPEQKRIRLQKAAQQNIDKTATPVPTAPVPQTPADIRKAKQAQAGQAAQDQMAPFSNLPADQAATQAANIRKAKQAQAAQNAQAQMAVKEDATVAAPGTYNKKTGAAKLGGKTMTALSDLPANVQQQIQAKQQVAAPTKATGTAMPLKPYQVPGAGTNPNPTTQPAGTTKPQIPATTPNNYMDDFEAWANQKTAMRDSTTYRTIGLADVKNTTSKENLKAELAAARQAVDTAQGNPTATKEAVKNYILTALAGAQLIASQNKVASASTPAPAAQQSSNPAAAGTAASGTGQTNAANSAQPIDINALLKSAGLDPVALQKAATVMQKATRNNKLSATGDDAIDGMLGLMGYKVS